MAEARAEAGKKQQAANLAATRRELQQKLEAAVSDCSKAERRAGDLRQEVDGAEGKHQAAVKQLAELRIRAAGMQAQLDRSADEVRSARLAATQAFSLNLSPFSDLQYLALV